MNASVITVDVREDLRQGREPFAKIMQAVTQLRSEQHLVLIAPFEPTPLYAVLGQQGFAHESTALPAGDWEVLFTRINGAAASIPAQHVPDAAKKESPTTLVDVDARGLEPPQPMVKILEALAALPDGAELHAHTDRRPMHLYAQLEERGFAGETGEQNDGSFITKIQRR